MGQLDEAVPAVIDLHERVRAALGLGSTASLPGALLAIPVLAGKLALCALAIVIVDTSFAKLRFFRIAEFLGAAFLLALVGIATSYVIGA